MNNIIFLTIPEICPICGGPTKIVTFDSGVKNLMCGNPDCAGKLINKLDYFCGKKGFDIKGISKATLEKLIDWEWINSISDIFNLANHRIEWIQKPGFGEKSVDKILAAIEAAKEITLDRFIASLGIPLIGTNASKELVKYIKTYEEFKEKINSRFDFSTYDTFAGSKTDAILNFDYSEADKIYSIITIKQNKKTESTASLEGINVVITGSLSLYKNRGELQKDIESLGGKVVGSVSKNTTYLINNDINSTSSKNATAKKLGIPIVTEQEFFEKFLKNS